MAYFPAEAEMAERKTEQEKAYLRGQVEMYLARSGGKLGCPHPAHRFASPRKAPSRLILPECAGRAAWLAARKEGIGGSEVGALIGVNEHETAMSIWSKKKRTEPDVELTGAPIEWGHRLEDVVAQKTAEEIGLVSRFGGGLWAMNGKEHIRVTPDRFGCKPRSWKAEAVIECKTAGDDEHWESGTIRPGGKGTGSAPLGYQAQIQWQMGILGLPVGYLGCFHIDRSRQFFTVEVHFDADWFGEMMETADDFWEDNILGDEIPLHDFRHPITEGLLKEQHPTVLSPSTDLPDLAEEWIKDYQRAKKRHEEAEAEFTAIKNEFRSWTGDAGAAYLGDEKIVGYPEVSTKRIDVEALKRDYPEVAEAVTVSSRYRRMTIRVPKQYKLPDA
jgi:putative phage-type endonuclease